MRTTSNFVKALAVISAIIPFCSQGFAQNSVIAYDNSSTDLSNKGYGVNGTEFGDQITLAPGTPRTVTEFKFEYFLNAIGSGTAQVFFYKNDGAATQVTQGNETVTVNAPGTLLYSSPVLTLGTQFQTADISGISVDVPDSFTWTVKFNVGQNDTAQLRLYDPPTVGSSFADFWQNSGGSWNTYLFDNGATPANFAARVYTAVPEPGTIALALVAGLGWIGFLGFKRRSA